MVQSTLLRGLVVLLVAVASPRLVAQSDDDVWELDELEERRTLPDDEDEDSFIDFGEEIEDDEDEDGDERLGQSVYERAAQAAEPKPPEAKEPPEPTPPPTKEAAGTTTGPDEPEPEDGADTEGEGTGASATAEGDGGTEVAGSAGAGDAGVGDAGAGDGGAEVGEDLDRVPEMATTLEKPAGGGSGLEEHWNRRQTFLREMDPSRAMLEEQALLRLKSDLGDPSLQLMSHAVIREGKRDLERGDSGDALKKALLAVQLAPDLPAAEMFRARVILANDLTKVGDAAGAIFATVKKSLQLRPARNEIIGNVALLSLVGLVVAGLIFMAITLGRCIRLFVHDFHHLFPDGVSRLQTGVVALAILLAPLVLRMGLALVGLVVAAAAWMYVTRRERVVLVLTLATFAVLPWLVTELADRTALGSAQAADVWALERTGTWGGPAGRIQDRVDAGTAEYAEVFALARYHKREGRLEVALPLYQRAIEMNPGGAEAYNNLGVVHYAVGDLEAAKAAFQQAVAMKSDLAPGYHNLSKVFFRKSELTQGQEARRRARDLDPGIVDAYPDQDPRLNVAVADARLPEDELARVGRGDGSSPAGQQLRVRISGVVPGVIGAYFPLASIGLLFIMGLVLSRTRVSQSCVKCGRSVCARCDRDVTGLLCGQCVNVFEKQVVAPQTRIDKERAILRFHAWRERIRFALGVVLPGAGHVASGRPLRGFAFLVLFVTGLVGVVFWFGPVPSSTSLGGGVQLWRVLLFGFVGLAAYIAAGYDLFRREE